MQQPHNIVFFGTPQFAVPSLQALIDADEPINLVVCQPDKPKGRGHKMSMPAVKELALKHGIIVLQPHSVRDEAFIEQIRSLHPEFIITAAYGKILPKQILDIPTVGCLNVHASLLPKYRGPAPIQHALLNGEKTTGVTIMLMDEGVDTGDIILQKAIEIVDTDTSATLFDKLSKLGASALLEAMQGLRNGSLSPVHQIGEPSYAPQLNKDDGRIDWDKPAKQIVNLIRAMTPWPSAFCYLGSERLKILLAKASYGTLPAGKLDTSSTDTIKVGTAEGILEILKLQPEGKKPMTARDFLLGRKIASECYLK